MPLMHGAGKKAFGENVSAEMHAGKPQKQALAIAYAVKRKAAKKMAEGGPVPSPSPNERPESQAQMIGRKAGEGAAAGLAASMKELHDKQGRVTQADAEHMAAGGMVPDEDMARKHDKIGSSPGVNGEIMHPQTRAPMIAEKKVLGQHHFGMKAQQHEDLDEPKEPIETVYASRSPIHTSDMHNPDYMSMAEQGAHLAHGGMYAPGGIVHKIMMKRKMAEGGEVKPNPSPSPVDEQNEKMGLDSSKRQLVAASLKKAFGNYAAGGEVEEANDMDDDMDDHHSDGYSTDNINLAEHPDNDFLSDEEQTPYKHLDADEHVEDHEDLEAKRKGVLEKVMRGLHLKHRGLE